MEYEIIISETCIEEIEEICDYIKKELKAEQASKRLRERVIEKISDLKKSPEIYARIEKTDREGRVYRRIVLNKYVNENLIWQIKIDLKI